MRTVNVVAVIQLIFILNVRCTSVNYTKYGWACDRLHILSLLF